MEGDDNWDLYAVVRGCRSAAPRDSSSPTVAAPEIRAPSPELTSFSNQFGELDDGIRELEELCRPFFFPSSQQGEKIGQPAQVQILSSSPSQQPVATPRPAQRALSVAQIPRSKRRKNQVKKVVCHVPADGLSSDVWAWRKYGQKPIKGSPYPRGYYKCSSLKGCPARKQVERSRTDPKLFIVTYTAEHNHAVPTHRNSLSGVSRHKFSASNEDGGGDRENGNAAVGGLSPTTPLMAKEGEGEEEEDEGVLLVEDMEVMGEDEFLFVEEEDIKNGGATAVGSAFDAEMMFGLLSHSSRAAGGS